MRSSKVSKKKQVKKLIKEKMPRKLQILVALAEPKYWNPNLTKLSKDLKIPISTVYDAIKQLKEEGRFAIINVKIKSDLEAMDMTMK